MNQLYIDEKFKDSAPEVTVARIQNILDDIGIKVVEKWFDSGVENCYSLNLCAEGGAPSTNGKGITKEFARASAYAEFIERLESGVYLTRYQSIVRDPSMDFHSFAPDGKYMTTDELIENGGEWMDRIIDSLNDPRVTRKTIAMNCKAYACADDDKIFTVPFYSLFEKKYVYMPASFVGRMYTANGNCAGNTREEAWVHALSEIMERNASRKMLSSGKAYPPIPDEILQKFPTVTKIINKIREGDNYDVRVLDCSLGNGFPVIATRVINKNEQTYLVNIGADPVLEIAIQRTMTELFQGRALDKLLAFNNGRILNKITDFPITSNILNQTQTSDGIYTADYFCEELSCEKKATDFVDNSDKNNKELLTYVLDLYKKMGLQVYVRNYSFLGFHSYKFVVPGFSETRGECLKELIPEYAFADSVCNTFRNVADATDEELSMLMIYSKKTKTNYNHYSSFTANAGVPFSVKYDMKFSAITRAYASYRLGDYTSAISFTKNAIKFVDGDIAIYFRCVNKYLQLKVDGISEDKIKVILYKFFKEPYPNMLYKNLNNGLTPYDDYLFKCDFKSCESCLYSDECSYKYLKKLTAKLGERYNAFVNGQDVSEFEI